MEQSRSHKVATLAISVEPRHNMKSNFNAIEKMTGDEDVNFFQDDSKKKEAETVG